MKRIIKKITAAAVALFTAAAMAGCSEYVMTEEDLALQKSLEGYWAADDSTGYNVYDEAGNMTSLLAVEFTDDFHYLIHNCLFDQGYALSFPPIEYSFEDELFKVVTDGVASYAKVEISDDGQTMYWITEDLTDKYTRLDKETAASYGIPEYSVEMWTETESESVSDSVSESVSDGVSDTVSETVSDTDKDGASAEAAAMAFTEPAPEDIEKFVNKLDPSLKYRENRESINISETPSVIAETEDGEIVLYGAYPDYYPLVFIEHDGIVDSFNQRWLTPRAILPQVMHEDIDGDGEKELAVSYYSGSGSGVAVMDLVIYERLADGHFSEYSFNAVNALEKAVEYSIDSEAHTLSFRVGDKSLNSEFTDELYPEGIEEIHWGNDIEYELKDGKITLVAAPNSSWHYEGMPCVTAQVVYTGDNADIEITDMSLFY